MDSIPRNTPLSPQVMGLTLRRAADHAHELDSAELPLPDGDVVSVVTVPEVCSWLAGLAVRAEAGEHL